jgi:hypothetical protein
MRYRGWYAVLIGLMVMGASPGAVVQVESGKLTVHAQGASLREVLGAITSQGGVTFKTISGGPVPDGRVTEEFTGLTMEQGLARLLSRWDYALVKEDGTDRLKEVYLFASGSGSEGGEVKEGEATPAGTGQEKEGSKGPDDEEIKKAIEAVRKAANPEEEAKAMLKLQYFHDEQTLEQVLQPALLAVSPKVRLAALETMYLREVRDPGILEEIRLMSVRDPDPAVRDKALSIARRAVPDIVHEGDSTAFWMNP